MKTVTRIVGTMRDLFFRESHEKVRDALVESFIALIECVTGTSRSRLVFDPILDEMRKGSGDHSNRLTACYILRKLNQAYINDDEVMNAAQCQKFA